MRARSILLVLTASAASLGIFGLVPIDARQADGDAHPSPHVQQMIEGSTYINKSEGFSLTVPAEWKVNDYIPNTTPNAVGAIGGLHGRAGIMIQKYGFPFNAGESKVILERAFSRGFQGYQKIRDVTITIDAKKAEGFIFAFRQPEARAGRELVVSGKVLVILFPHGANVFAIMCEASDPDFDRLEGSFEKIAASYRPFAH